MDVSGLSKDCDDAIMQWDIFKKGEICGPRRMEADSLLSRRQQVLVILEDRPVAGCAVLAVRACSLDVKTKPHQDFAQATVLG